MKKIIPLFFLVYLTHTSFGQITITKNDMPAIGDTIRYSNTSTIVNFTNTGPNYTWDFSSLVITGQGIDTFESALRIDPLFIIYFGLTDYGVPSTNKIDFSALSLTNAKDYYNTTSSYLEINGISADYSGIPLPTTYTIPDKVYQFPLTYGQTTSTPYDVNIQVPSVAGVHQVGTRTNTVDGWGTVITPYDTFQCIRVKSVLSEVDSLDITAVGLSIGIPLPTVTYKWLANHVIIPVLEVDGFDLGGTFVPTSEKFRDGWRAVPNNFTISNNFVANKTICTTDDTINLTPTVNPSGIAGTTYKYTLVPDSGFHYIAATDSTTEIPNLKFNLPGLYTVSLYTTAPAGGTYPATATTTKPNYIYVTYPDGISQIAGPDALEVYPNPANQYISCRLNADGSNKMTVELLTITGQALYTLTTPQQGEAIIPTSRFPTGEYLLRATTASGSSYVRKVSIVH